MHNFLSATDFVAKQIPKLKAITLLGKGQEW